MRWWKKKVIKKYALKTVETNDKFMKIIVKVTAAIIITIQ